VSTIIEINSPKSKSIVLGAAFAAFASLAALTSTGALANVMDTQTELETLTAATPQTPATPIKQCDETEYYPGVTDQPTVGIVPNADGTDKCIFVPAQLTTPVTRPVAPVIRPIYPVYQQPIAPQAPSETPIGSGGGNAGSGGETSTGSGGGGSGGGSDNGSGSGKSNDGADKLKSAILQNAAQAEKGIAADQSKISALQAKIAALSKQNTPLSKILLANAKAQVAALQKDISAKQAVVNSDLNLLKKSMAFAKMGTMSQKSAFHLGTQKPKFAAFNAKPDTAKLAQTASLARLQAMRNASLLNSRRVAMMNAQRQKLAKQNAFRQRLVTSRSINHPSTVKTFNRSYTRFVNFRRPAVTRPTAKRASLRPVGRRR
jgi:hypothetical protein